MKATKSEPELIRAEGTAFNLLKQYGVRDPGRLCLEDLAMALGIVVREGQLEGAEARLVRQGERGIIRVQKGIPEAGRKRYAIAHELGHWSNHRDRSQLVVCLEEDVQGYSESHEELEANAFASELLMPKRLVRERYGKIVTSLKLIGRAAEELNTTFTATAVRLVELSKEPHLVVFSEGGRVRWWRRSEGSWLHLERRQTISEGSVAHSVTKGESRSTAPERVAAESWFEHIPGHEKLEVFEESMRLGHYPTVVTILTIRR